MTLLIQHIYEYAMEGKDADRAKEGELIINYLFRKWRGFVYMDNTFDAVLSVELDGLRYIVCTIEKTPGDKTNEAKYEAIFTQECPVELKKYLLEKRDSSTYSFGSRNTSFFSPATILSAYFLDNYAEFDVLGTEVIEFLTSRYGLTSFELKETCRPKKINLFFDKGNYRITLCGGAGGMSSWPANTEFLSEVTGYLTSTYPVTLVQTDLETGMVIECTNGSNYLVLSSNMYDLRMEDEKDAKVKRVFASINSSLSSKDFVDLTLCGVSSDNDVVAVYLPFMQQTIGATITATKDTNCIWRRGNKAFVDAQNKVLYLEAQLQDAKEVLSKTRRFD